MSNTLEEYKTILNNFLKDKSIFYFVRDPERGLGLETVLNNYHLIHIIESQYSEYFTDIGLHHFCLEKNSNIPANPHGGARLLLNDKKVLNYIATNKKNENFAQTFKINPAFQKSAQNLGLNLLNTSAELNRAFEEKIKQYQNISEKVKLPKTIIGKFADLSYLQIVQQLGETFVIQFSRGHTGSGTHVIETEEDYELISSENTQRIAKFSTYVQGIPYTLNACVTGKGTYIGGLSLQITGDKDLGALRGSTIGNDWSKRINIEDLTEIKNQCEVIGSIMYSKGFRGMFGVDFVVKDTGELFVIEINARQTASVPMWTKVQLLKGEVPLSMLHLFEFMNLPITIDVNSYNDRNLQPDNFSQISNRAEKELTITHLVNMGIYRLQGDNAAQNRYTEEIAPTTIFLDEDRDKALLYQNYATNIASMERQGVLVLAPVANRKLSKGDEIVRIQLMQSAVDDNGIIVPWVKEALKAIKYHQL